MKLPIACVVLVSFLQVIAHADIINYSGVTDPSLGNFNRPTETGTAISSSVPYATFPFSVIIAGNYQITLKTTENNPGLFDTFLILYTAPFNAGSPLSNFVIANDNLNNANIPLGSGFTTSLTSGTNYVLAIAGLTNDDYGTYSGRIASVPEPSSLALLIAAILCSATLSFHRIKRLL